MNASPSHRQLRQPGRRGLQHLHGAALFVLAQIAHQLKRSVELIGPP